jgi:hypothetical protein
METRMRRERMKRTETGKRKWRQKCIMRWRKRRKRKRRRRCRSRSRNRSRRRKSMGMGCSSCLNY